MERFIRQLIAYDQQGQLLVREAKELSRQTLANTDGEKQALMEQLSERAEHKVEYYREHAEAEKRDALAALHTQHQQKCERLRAQFAEKQDGWVDEMTARCLGR